LCCSGLVLRSASIVLRSCAEMSPNDFLDADMSDILPLMPQPFERRPNQTVTVDPEAILQRPALGVLIAHVSAQWSILEQSLTLSFATILSGQEPSALVNYNALFDINIRHSQFLATAKSKGLPQTLIEESEALHARIRKVSTRRNKVIHGIWAVCPDRRNSLLLCQPDAMNTKLASHLHGLHSLIDLAHGKQPLYNVTSDLTPDNYEEYVKNDFVDLTKTIVSLNADAENYWHKMMEFSIQHERSRREPPR
jgi:hypothetical protein